ncbi:hypothetical protein O3P69_017454 [Scylla paramamosain]|uniref:Uncharacterized protein n=1 Tax=Scylla paramamosain TaxID=85552 RepID=A0AAW0TWC7_SCYPA
MPSRHELRVDGAVYFRACRDLQKTTSVFRKVTAEINEVARASYDGDLAIIVEMEVAASLLVRNCEAAGHTQHIHKVYCMIHQESANLVDVLSVVVKVAHESLISSFPRKSCRLRHNPVLYGYAQSYITVKQDHFKYFIYVLNLEVDFALGPMGISEDRSEVMDVSVPLFMDQQTIAYKRPELQPELAGFIKPFTSQRRRETVPKFRFPE